MKLVTRLSGSDAQTLPGIKLEYKTKFLVRSRVWSAILRHAPTAARPVYFAPGRIGRWDRAPIHVLIKPTVQHLFGCLYEAS